MNYNCPVDYSKHFPLAQEIQVTSIAEMVEEKAMRDNLAKHGKNIFRPYISQISSKKN
jgi:hypothetical protein